MALQTIGTTGMTVDEIRPKFLTPARSMHGHPLLYLNNASSRQKLRFVLHRPRDFYEFEYANTNEENSLSRNVTNAVSDVRSSIGNLLGSSSPGEIVFVRKRDGGGNLCCLRIRSFPASTGDEVAMTKRGNDSNFLRSQIACQRSGAKLRIARVESSGELDSMALENGFRAE